MGTIHFLVFMGKPTGRTAMSSSSSRPFCVTAFMAIEWKSYDYHDKVKESRALNCKAMRSVLAGT